MERRCAYDREITVNDLAKVAGLYLPTQVCIVHLTCIKDTEPGKIYKSLFLVRAYAYRIKMDVIVIVKNM